MPRVGIRCRNSGELSSLMPFGGDATHPPHFDLVAWPVSHSAFLSSLIPFFLPLPSSLHHLPSPSSTSPSLPSSPFPNKKEEEKGGKVTLAPLFSRFGQDLVSKRRRTELSPSPRIAWRQSLYKNLAASIASELRRSSVVSESAEESSVICCGRDSLNPRRRGCQARIPRPGVKSHLIPFLKEDFP